MNGRSAWLVSLLVLGLVVGVALGLRAYLRLEPDLTLRVRFADAGGVAPGAPVRFRGLDIGEVEAVGLADGLAELAVHVDDRFRDQVCEDATFRTRIDGQGAAGARFLEMERDTGACAPIQPGTIVRGVDDPVDGLLRKGRRMLERGASAFKEGLGDLKEEAGTRADELGERAGELGERLDRRADELGRKAEELGARLSERAAELGAKAGELGLGLMTVAEALVTALDDWAATLDSQVIAENAQKLAADVTAAIEQGLAALEREWPRIQERLDGLLEDLRQQGRDGDADRLEREVEEEAWT